MVKVSRALALLFLVMLAGALPARAQPMPGKDAALSGAPKPEEPTFTIENSLTIRDPFRRWSPNAAQGDDSTPELERYETDKFQLIAVITGPRKPRAMLRDPANKMHIVTQNTKIGTRRGIIKRIEPGAIEVEEKVVNLLGQEEAIETLIEMKESKLDKKGK